MYYWSIYDSDQVGCEIVLDILVHTGETRVSYLGGLSPGHGERVFRVALKAISWAPGVELNYTRRIGNVFYYVYKTFF